MSEIFESHTVLVGSLGYYAAYGTQWQAQTFTPQAKHTITSVKLKMYRTGLPGTITISIQPLLAVITNPATSIAAEQAQLNGELSADHPDGLELCSGTYDGDILPDAIGDAVWVEVDLGAGATLYQDVEYAIIVKAPSGGSGKYVWIGFDNTVGGTPYTRGDIMWTNTEGLYWSDRITDDDFLFEEWGDALATTGSDARDCGFEYGLTTSYGETTPTESKVAEESFSQVVTGLSPEILYHFRAFATNVLGTIYGEDETFTTLALPAVWKGDIHIDQLKYQHAERMEQFV